MSIDLHIYFNGRRIARRDASGTVYYFITDHIGNVRVVANASGGVVEESDYLPFGTENVITSTLDNNYKFIGMERDFEGTAALDHTLYRQYAPNLARWTTPDPVHGSPASPQTWNRYPYVINDPMTKIDPLGGSHQDYDPYFVGCFPDPFFESLFGGFGCGYSADSKCPPGYEEIYGDPRPDRRGGPAIETLNSVYDYAQAVLGEFAESIELGPNGVTVTFSSQFTAQILIVLGREGIKFGIKNWKLVVGFLRLATVAVLADAIDELFVECKLIEENPGQGLHSCLYECGPTDHRWSYPAFEPPTQGNRGSYCPDRKRFIRDML